MLFHKLYLYKQHQAEILFEIIAGISYPQEFKKIYIVNKKLVQSIDHYCYISNKSIAPRSFCRLPPYVDYPPILHMSPLSLSINKRMEDVLEVHTSYIFSSLQDCQIKFSVNSLLKHVFQASINLLIFCVILFIINP